MGCGCNYSGGGYNNAAGGGKGMVPEPLTTYKILSEGTPGVEGSMRILSRDGIAPPIIKETGRMETAYNGPIIWGPPMYRTRGGASDMRGLPGMTSKYDVPEGTVIKEGTPGVEGSREVKSNSKSSPGMVVTSTRKTPHSYINIGFPTMRGLPPSVGARTSQSGDMRGLPGMTGKVADGTPATTPKYKSAQSGDILPSDPVEFFNAGGIIKDDTAYLLGGSGYSNAAGHRGPYYSPPDPGQVSGGPCSVTVTYVNKSGQTVTNVCNGTLNRRGVCKPCNKMAGVGKTVGPKYPGFPTAW
jgi:hypothetical protein